MTFPTTDHALRSFYGVRDRWFGPDVLYRVFVTPDAVCGARVGGGWGVFLGRLAILGELAPVLPIKLTADARLESRYVGIDPRSPAFLSQDPRNFRLHAAQVQRVELAERAIFGKRRRRATVTFARRDSRERFLLHVTPSDLPAVADALKGTAFRVVDGR